MMRRTVRSLGFGAATLVLVLLVGATTAFANSVDRWDPQGSISLASPTIQAHLMGSNGSAWGPASVVDRSSIVMKIDGVVVGPLTFSAASNDVTVSVVPTSPLTPGTHSVFVTANVFSGTTTYVASRFWTFEYQPTGSARTSIADVYPFINTFGFPWNGTVRVAVTDGSVAVGTGVVVIDGISYGMKPPDSSLSSDSDLYNHYVTDTLRLSPGYHTAVATVRDSAGHSATRSWTFLHDIAGAKTQVTPGDGWPGASTQTSIVATITTFAPLNQSSVVMTVNGQQVSAAYTAVAGNIARLNYTPTVPLTSESSTTVSISGVDIYGLGFQRTWQFMCKQNPDMDLSSETCRACHGSDFNALHLDSDNMVMSHITYTDDPIRNQMPDGFLQCIRCHDKLTTPVWVGSTISKWYTLYAQSPLHGDALFKDYGGHCYVCHSGYPGINIADTATIHGHSMDWSMNSLPAGASIDVPREQFDCAYCHQKGSAAPYAQGPHDVRLDHASSLDSSCAPCHESVLTVEHALRQDANGKALTCESCHASGNSSVKAASGISFLDGKERWVSEVHGKGAAVGTATVGPWVYDGGKPVTRVKVDILGTATSRLFAFYDNAWHQVWSLGPLYQYTQHSLLGDVWINEYNGDPRFTATVDVPGATKFKWEFDYRRNHPNGARASLTVIETNPPRVRATCATCHGSTGHVTQHETALDSKCATCHSTNLMSEHVTTRGKSCLACHAGASAQAVSFAQTKCSDCHATAHDQRMRASNPGSLTLDPSFTWSAPVPLSLFDGESWVPTEAVGRSGYVVTSNRAHVTGAQESAYFVSRMKAAGWVLSSPEPEASSDFYTISFRAGTRRAALIFYGGNRHDATPVNPAGYRAQVLYWDMGNQ